MDVWTRDQVGERLAEAADVLKRLPDAKGQGYFSTWPQIVHEFADLVGQEPPRLRRSAGASVCRAPPLTVAGSTR